MSRSATRGGGARTPGRSAAVRRITSSVRVHPGCDASQSHTVTPSTPSAASAHMARRCLAAGGNGVESGAPWKRRAEPVPTRREPRLAVRIVDRRDDPNLRQSPSGGTRRRAGPSAPHRRGATAALEQPRLKGSVVGSAAVWRRCWRWGGDPCRLERLDVPIVHWVEGATEQERHVTHSPVKLMWTISLLDDRPGAGALLPRVQVAPPGAARGCSAGLFRLLHAQGRLRERPPSPAPPSTHARRDRRDLHPK